jgi:AcrR family transcriptional regulator
MPRIAAATVVEHHALVKARLVDAAEAILRAGEPLTAQAVSEAAGIARNSIYRYVEAVTDLRGLVIERYLPAWVEAVDGELAGTPDPGARIVVWVRANLSWAAQSGHGWLMGSVRSSGGASEVDQAHSWMRDALQDAWLRLLAGDAEKAGVAAALTNGVLEAGFRQLDAGRPAALVIEVATAATEGLVARLRGGNDAGQR